MRWQDWMNVLIGLWLIFAPPLMAYTGGPGGVAAVNSYLVGIGLIVLSLLGLVVAASWREWLVIVLAIWLIVSPFVLDFLTDGTEAWNSIISGIVVLIGAVQALRARGKGPVGA